MTERFYPFSFEDEFIPDYDFKKLMLNTNTEGLLDTIEKNCGFMMMTHRRKMILDVVSNITNVMYNMFGEVVEIKLQMAVGDWNSKCNVSSTLGKFGVNILNCNSDILASLIIFGNKYPFTISTFHDDSWKNYSITSSIDWVLVFPEVLKIYQSTDIFSTILKTNVEKACEVVKNNLLDLRRKKIEDINLLETLIKNVQLDGQETPDQLRNLYDELETKEAELKILLFR